jgi:hypothetical protein
MTKEREYRAYAGTCVDLANKATNDEDKKHLLAMAEAWLGLADRVQRPLPELLRGLRACTHKIANGDSGLIKVRFGALRGLKSDISRGRRSARSCLRCANRPVSGLESR